MPVVASKPYLENEKAGGAFENAAEEILNGIFCHYEPPASTKAQKNAADSVRSNPTKFLYEEQPTKPILRMKKKGETPSQQEEQQPKEETREDTTEAPQEEAREEPEEELEIPDDPETPSKKRGIKWRDEESKRQEEEKNKQPAPSMLQNAAALCVSIPILGCVGKQAEEEMPSTLADTLDAGSVAPETPGATQTPTSGILKKRDSGMKVIYDDEGNPISTPKSPIHNHPFFKNTPTAEAVAPGASFKVSNRNPTPRFQREEVVEALNKIGRSAPQRQAASSSPHAPTSPATYVPTSPANYKTFGLDDYQSDGEVSVKNIVQHLNKKGFSPRTPRNFKSPSNETARSDLTELSEYQYKNRKSTTPKNNSDTRGSLNVSTVAAPSPSSILKSPGGYSLRSVGSAPPTPRQKEGDNQDNNNEEAQKPNPLTPRAMAIDTSIDVMAPSEPDMNRDPTPRQMSVKALTEHFGSNVSLPPTPRRVRLEFPAEEQEQTAAPVEQKAASSTKPTTKTKTTKKPQEKENAKKRSNSKAQKSEGKKGFFKGIKKSLKKAKAIVNEIDEGRVAQPSKKKLVRNNGAVIRHV
jgi:hypothetical protein